MLGNLILRFYSGLLAEVKYDLGLEALVAKSLFYMTVKKVSLLLSFYTWCNGISEAELLAQDQTASKILKLRFLDGGSYAFLYKWASITLEENLEIVLESWSIKGFVHFDRWYQDDFYKGFAKLHSNPSVEKAISCLQYHQSYDFFCPLDKWESAAPYYFNLHFSNG